MKNKRIKSAVLISIFLLLFTVPITTTNAATGALLTLEKISSISVIQVDVDIKPGSWPNPINLKSNGVLPVAICGTEDFYVDTIDPATVNIGGVTAIRWSYEDVATPFEGDEGEGHTLDGDRYPDLVLHFDTQLVVNTLTLTYYIGETIPLIIKGNLKEEHGGTPIKGQDFVRILGKVLKPFVIDDTGGGDYTWKKASKQWWCQGVGTEEDPYIIENIAINGEGSIECLVIRDSVAHFIIRDCRFYNSEIIDGVGSAALVLEFVTDGKLIKNDFSNNGGNGISIINSHDVIVQDNICEENNWGIFLVGVSYNNLIERNICTKNLQGGILIYFGSYNVINENDCSENFWGIVLSFFAHHNSVTGNIISNNHIGIVVADSSNYNTFTENDIIENTIDDPGPPYVPGIGIWVGNTVEYTGPVPSNNEFYHNNIINNPIQAVDNSDMLYWYDPLNDEGNYWSDYDDCDDDNDGIWDNPYLVYGSAGNRDIYPFVNENGWV